LAAYIVEAQVSLPYITNLPRDVAVNTFHFRAADGTSTADAAADAAAVLVDFYNELDSPQTVSVATYISKYVSRASGSAMIKVYDLSDPLPREPIGTSTFTLDNAGAATSLPMEIALCSSYRSAFLSGVPTASCRGRVYIGPLATTANTASNDLPARPSTAFQTNLALATEGIITACAATDLTWVTWSRTLQRADDVIAGFVDDEWDVQRRRGVDSTARATWP